MMHKKRFKSLVDACRNAPAAASMDCAGIVKMAGARTDTDGSRIEGLPGLLLQKNRDQSGAVVGALLIDADSGDQRYVMDFADLQKLEGMDNGQRMGYVRASATEVVLSKGFCNQISLLCIAGTQGMRRGELEGIHAFMNGKYTVIYPGNAVNLEHFVFKAEYPSVIGQSREMEVNWAKMAEKHGDVMLLLGDYIGKQNDATKFGSITVTRTSATTVQISPNNFDFDLTKSIAETLKGGLRSRDTLTLIGGLFALGFSTPAPVVGGVRTQYGPGRPVTVVFDGHTPLPPNQKP